MKNASVEVRLSEKELAVWKSAATERQVSLSEFVRMAVDKFIERGLSRQSSGRKLSPIERAAAKQARHDALVASAQRAAAAFLDGDEGPAREFLWSVESEKEANLLWHEANGIFESHESHESHDPKESFYDSQKRRFERLNPLQAIWKIRLREIAGRSSGQ